VNPISDEGFLVLNEIMNKSKIEILNLKSNNSFQKKGIEITKKGIENMKESLINNKYLKNLNISSKLKLN
jgi:hypothetical protein